MQLHFLWIIGGSLFFAWLGIHLFFVAPGKVNMPRSWYSTPVIGLVMVFTWLGFKLIQILP